MEREKKFATTKSPRSGTWEPTIVTDITNNMDVENKDSEDLPVELEMVFTDTQTKKRTYPQQPAVPKKKFIDYLKETTNIEDLLDEIMD